MQLLILAAGHGRRFGGLKQLAPVGPSNQAIMDYTAYAARDCGYEGVVLVLRPDIEDEVRAHVARFWPKELPVEVVHQRAGVAGTAQAVQSAKDAIAGYFAVANADDLYEGESLELIARHASQPDASSLPHVLVGYRLVRTVLTDEPVTRGLCRVGEDGVLEAIIEQVVELRDDGSFDARPLREEFAHPRQLSGVELVSMNLWGFSPRIFGHLEDALARSETAGRSRELILVEVVNEVVSSHRDHVHVLETMERCIGITHPEDLDIVRDELAVVPRSSLLKH